MLFGCPSGTIGQTDAGCTGTGCIDGDAEADADADEELPPDPCDSIECNEGYECVDGMCREANLCADVLCANPGEDCDRRTGNCVSGAADDDEDGHTIADGDCDDGDATRHPGATELCDGIDQNCDLVADEGFPDLDDDGFDTCGFGDPDQADCDDNEALRRPGLSERCDGLDNDCDDVIDDGIDIRSCSTACADGEERCEGGEWHCSAPVTCECTPAGTSDEEGCGWCGTRSRTCDDDDLRWSEWSLCSNEGTCPAGNLETESCGWCGERQRSCSSSCYWNEWESCTDEGECEAGTSEDCTTTCGSVGTHRCSGSCSFGGCSPPEEACSGVDDDCDGEIDEDFRAEIVTTSFAELATYYSACDGSSVPRIGLECNTAIHEFCAARSCTVSGFGPIEWSGDTAYVVCVAGAEVVPTSYTELSAIFPQCDGGPDQEVSLHCASTVKRSCVARGAVSGFGPYLYGGAIGITCVNGAEIILTDYAVLDSFNPGCDGVDHLWGAYCHAAINRYCQSLTGMTSGFGPVEVNSATGDVFVTCAFP